MVEMHAPKLILIFAFYLSVNEVSVLHLIIAILAVSACATRTSLQGILCRLISLVVGLLLIVKMVYQIQYIDHQKLVVTDCVSLENILDILAVFLIFTLVFPE